MLSFSIVVPAYNAQQTLAETLDAVRAQTFSEWECIVVDDGSTDATLEVARTRAEADARFKVLSQENRGTGGAYNTGVRAATAPWVTICSADDLLLPQHLEVMARAIQGHPGFDIISCNGYYLRPDGTRELVYAGEAGGAPRSWLLEDLFDRCFFSVGACYRRALFDSAGGYLEDAYGEDYDFWLRAVSGGAKHLYIPDPLAVHRTAPTQKSANHVRAFESDIISIRRVVTAGGLSTSQRRAARKAIAFRRRMISEIVSPTSLPNRVRKQIRRLRASRRAS